MTISRLIDYILTFECVACLALLIGLWATGREK